MIKNKFIDYLQRLWYEVNWKYILLAFKFYVRRWQIANLPKMGQFEPVIYVANHQGAFLDAIAVIMSQKRHPIYLVRANIFSTPLARFFLRSVNLFPIYRQRDGGDTISKNEKIFQDCIDVLTYGRQPLAIYAEGNHSMLRSLRPLKKGVGRIAFSTLEQNNFNIRLKIIPVGVTYSKHTRIRGDILVNYGKPIIVNDYKDVYKENPNKAYVNLNSDIAKSLSSLIVNISDRENYEEIEKAWISERKIFDNMLDELHNDQKIIARLTKEKQEGKQLKIKPIEKTKKSVIFMGLGFPAFIYGTLNSLPLYFIINRLLSKVVTDIHFYGSIKVAAGTHIGGIIYFLQAIGVYALSEGNIWIASIYFVSLPFFGTFAYDHFLKYYSDEPYTTSSAELLKGYK